MKLNRKSTWFDVVVELLSIDVVCKEHLTPDRLAVVHEEFTRRNVLGRSFFLKPFMRGLQNGCSFSAALMAKLSPDDLHKCWNGCERIGAEPLDGPAFSYYYSDDHEKINNFLRVVAESPADLALMKKGDISGIKEFVSAHAKQYEYEYKSWSGRVSIEHEHDRCGDCCHADAKRILELLG